MQLNEISRLDKKKKIALLPKSDSVCKVIIFKSPLLSLGKNWGRKNPPGFRVIMESVEATAYRAYRVIGAH